MSRWLSVTILMASIVFCICFVHEHSSGGCSHASHDGHDHHHHHHHDGHDNHHHDHNFGVSRSMLPEELAEEEDLKLYGFGSHRSLGDDDSELSRLGLWVHAMGCSMLVSMASLICLIFLPVIFLKGKPSKTVVDSLAVFGELTTRKMVGRGIEREGLYYFNDGVKNLAASVAVSDASPVFDSSVSVVVSSDSVSLWHARLGHIGFKILCIYIPVFQFLCNSINFKCEICELSKHSHSSYPAHMHRSHASFDLVHSDVWGLSLVISLDGFGYYVVFIDDCTRLIWLYPFKIKG